MLSLLVLAAISGATAVGPDRRAKVHELKGRLGFGPDAVRSDLRERLIYIRKTWPGFPVEAATMLARHYVDLHGAAERGDETDDLDFFNAGYEVLPPRGLRAPVLERMLPWFAREVARGIDLWDLPWSELALAEGAVPRFVIDRMKASEVTEEQFPTGETWFSNGAGRWKDHRPVLARERDRAGPLMLERGEIRTVFISADESGDIRRVRGTWRGPVDLMISWHVGANVDLQGALAQDTSQVSSSDFNFTDIFDWIDQTSPDLSALRFAEAIAAAAAWHAQFATTADFRSKVPVESADRILATWPDGSRLVELHSKKSLEREGFSMGHCVGGYWPDVRDGESGILSYRGPFGVPFITAELTDGDGELVQIVGVENASLRECFESVNVNLREADAVAAVRVCHAILLMESSGFLPRLPRSRLFEDLAMPGYDREFDVSIRVGGQDAAWMATINGDIEKWRLKALAAVSNPTVFEVVKAGGEGRAWLGWNHFVKTYLESDLGRWVESVSGFSHGEKMEPSSWAGGGRGIDSRAIRLSAVVGLSALQVDIKVEIFATREGESVESTTTWTVSLPDWSPRTEEEEGEGETFVHAPTLYGAVDLAWEAGFLSMPTTERAELLSIIEEHAGLPSLESASEQVTFLARPTHRSSG